MSKLKHSREGFLRYMQTSRNSVFIFVEGKDIDSYIYGNIVSQICNPRGIGYDIFKIDIVEPGAGGKNAILDYHDYLRRQASLTTKLAGKTSIVAFFLDKDIDDLNSIKRRSKHIIYTEYYDVHNYIYLAGDLVKGSSAAGSFDPNLVKSLLINSHKWCNQASKRWIKWVVLCIFSLHLGIKCQCNYSVPSKINCPITGNEDTNQYKTYLDELLIKSGMTKSIFFRKLKHIEKCVDSYFNNDRADQVFKGKWYAILLAEDISKILLPLGYNATDITKTRNRLDSCIAATLDFSDNWCKYFQKKLADTLQSAGIF